VGIALTGPAGIRGPRHRSPAASRHLLRRAVNDLHHDVAAFAREILEKGATSGH